MKMVTNCLNRHLWSSWKARLSVKQKAKGIIHDGHYKNGNERTYVAYKCAHCGELHRDVDVDHIECRISPTVGWVSLDEWVKRSFVGEAKLQVLCEECHKRKSAQEVGVRAEHRRSKEKINDKT